MPKVHFTPLTHPTLEIAQTLNRWENDPALTPFIRINQNEEDLNRQRLVTLDSLIQRLTNHTIYLIYLDETLIGEVSYQVNHPVLFKQDLDSAWLGISIGEASARGQGIGYQAMLYLEEQVKLHGLTRIELGVFEFNTQAIKLYQKVGYKEIARIPETTYWQGKMWQDIRMEKYIG